MTAWKLPFLVAAIAVPIAVAFLVGGPAVGVAMGALTAVAIVAYAARQRPREAIEPDLDGSGTRRVLVVVTVPLEDPRARQEAQRRLVISVASLAAAGIEAEARVGDEDVVQAVEDRPGSFPASEVILVSAAGGGAEAAAEAARELQTRLRTDFRWVLSGPATR